MKAPLLFALLAVAAAPSHATEAPKVEIQTFVDTFSKALKAHDVATFRTLFTPEASWVEALGAESLQKVRQKKPDAGPYHTSTPAKFVDFVGSTKAPIEERFHDVRIETDGTVSMVYFTFEFMIDGKVQNHGAETWQMVRTADGWKIAAMLYSSNF